MEICIVFIRFVIYEKYPGNTASTPNEPQYSYKKLQRLFQKQHNHFTDILLAIYFHIRIRPHEICICGMASANLQSTGQKMTCWAIFNWKKKNISGFHIVVYAYKCVCINDKKIQLNICNVNIALVSLIDNVLFIANASILIQYFRQEPDV